MAAFTICLLAGILPPYPRYTRSEQRCRVYLSTTHTRAINLRTFVSNLISMQSLSTLMNRFVGLSVLIVLGLISTALLLGGASPQIGVITAAPQSVPVNVPTPLTVTVQITDPTLLTGSVDLVRPSDPGAAPIILAQMHDDGQNGDAVAGDHIYTAQLSYIAPNAGPQTLQVSAAFRGHLQRVTANTPNLVGTGLLMSDLKNQSSLILRGTVIALQTTSTTDQSGVMTIATISVTQTIRGVPPQSGQVQIDLAGGDANQINATFLQAADIFMVGEDVLLLLSGPASNGHYSMTAGASSKFDIYPDQSLGQVAVIDPGYSSQDLGTPLDTTLIALLARSAARQLALTELLSTLSP